MLLSFGAENFCCFKEITEINLEFNSKIPVEISNNLNATKSLCLKGANSSGKTNAIKILAFISHFCKNSFKDNPEDLILVDSYFQNTNPIEFFVKFEINNIEYLYELSLVKEKIIYEKIFKKDKRKTLILHRKYNDLKINNIFNNKNIIIRNNASIISTAKQYEIKEMDIFYNFFFNISSNVGYNGLKNNLISYNKLSKFYLNNNDYLEFTKKYLQKFDMSIENITIKSYTNERNEVIYYPEFIHKTDSENRTLSYESQSSGTIQLYLYLYLYYNVLKTGGVLLLDEFDVNLHPDILPHLVKLFEDEEINKQNAQLIFSTHNTDIIDVMGKYKTYLFNKENSESYCYRLDEINSNIIRNDRPITPLYKSGKIGGIPKI